MYTYITNIKTKTFLHGCVELRDRHSNNRQFLKRQTKSTKIEMMVLVVVRRQKHN